MRNPLRLGMMLIVMMVVVWYLLRHGREFLLLREFDLRFLPLMLCVTLVAIAVNGWILRMLVSRFGVRLTFEESYGLTTLHSFGNYLPLPQAGSLARGLYLKKKHALSYSAFTATVLLTYVQFLVSVGCLGLAAIIILRVGGSASPWPLWLLFAGLTSTVLLLYPASWLAPVVRRLQLFSESVVILRRRRILIRVGLLQIFLIAINAIGLWLAFASLGRPVPLIASLLLALVSMASGIVNITPGNLGVAESAAWFTAHLIRTDADEAVVAFALSRLVSVLVIFTLTPLFTSRLSASTPANLRTSGPV